MFFAAGSDGLVTPLEMSGVGATPEIASLQEALAHLSAVARRPAAHPGPATGVIGEKTMISIAGLLDKIQSALPMWVIHPLQKAMMLGVSSTEAKNTIGRYVTELKIATLTAADKFQGLPELPEFQQPSALSGLPPFFVPGWYKSVPRLAIVGGLILVGMWAYHHFLRK